MDSTAKDRKVNTTIPNNRRNAAGERRGTVGERRQPHERDEAPDAAARPRGVMKQAASDLAQGLVDTDLHNIQGIDRGVRPRGPADPIPDAGQGMRDQP